MSNDLMIGSMRDRILQAHAHNMRKDMPECEQRLWQRLRGKQLDGFKFRRQYVISPYIVDFASRSARLVVEVDGESHGNDVRERLDLERTKQLERNGWRVIRFWTTELATDMDSVVRQIWDALHPGCIAMPPP